MKAIVALRTRFATRSAAIRAPAADTPAQRATIEVVALLFQSILMEDRLPATV